MLIKFSSKLQTRYLSKVVNFNHPGEIVDVPDDYANYLLSEQPDDFTKVDSDDEEESSSDDEDSSESLSEVLGVLESGEPLKITEIADEMGVSWQSIRSDMNGLLNNGKVSKNTEGQYQIV